MVQWSHTQRFLVRFSRCPSVSTPDVCIAVVIRLLCCWCIQTFVLLVYSDFCVAGVSRLMSCLCVYAVVLPVIQACVLPVYSNCHAEDVLKRVCSSCCAAGGFKLLCYGCIQAVCCGCVQAVF